MVKMGNISPLTGPPNFGVVSIPFQPVTKCKARIGHGHLRRLSIQPIEDKLVSVLPCHVV
ncbi:unnamed protein product [Rhodiola kirilowii]